MYINPIYMNNNDNWHLLSTSYICHDLFYRKENTLYTKLRGKWVCPPSPLLLTTLTQNTSMTRCVGFLLRYQFSDTSCMSYNSVQFWDYLELASDPTSKRFNPTRLPTLQTPKKKSQVVTSMTSCTFSRIAHKNQGTPYLHLQFIVEEVIRDTDGELDEELHRMRPKRLSAQELLWLRSWGCATLPVCVFTNPEALQSLYFRDFYGGFIK